jgi:raffinose/stachyose/melibiose transport system substrate-binding protein
MNRQRPGRVVIAAMSTAALTALAACGNGASVNGSSSSGGSITIFNTWSDPSQKPAADALIAAFAKATGIQVSNSPESSNGATYGPAIRSALSSSNPPDVATDISGPEVYSFAQGAELRDITGFYESSIAPRALPGAITGSVLDGKVYGISDGFSVGNLVWYNPSYLAKYGVNPSSVTNFTTWVAAMTKIKNAGGTPIVLGAKDQWTGGHYLNDLVQRAIGSKAATALYNRTVLAKQPDTPKWTDPAVVRAFQDFVSLKGLFQQGFLGESEATAESQFLAGNVGFYEMGSWLTTSIEAAKPSFKPGVMLFPPLVGGEGKANEVTLANDVLIVSKDSNWASVKKFLAFFTRPDTVATFGDSMQRIMPYKAAAGVGTVSPTIATQWAKINQFAKAAGPDGTALFNDQAVDVNIYQTYLWQGSVGLMSGAVSAQKLAQELESATEAAQASHK